MSVLKEFLWFLPVVGFKAGSLQGLHICKDLCIRCYNCQCLESQSQSVFVLIWKQKIATPTWSVYCTSLCTSDAVLVDFCFFFTYPGVSSLLKFLCNGLIRGHDNKHLDGHVEDGHGDQEGHIVSVERKMDKRLNINYSQRGTENTNTYIFILVALWGLYVCVPYLSPLL